MSERAEEFGGWGPDTTPWLRTEQIGDPQKEAHGFAQCYFCGEHSIKRSWDDIRADNGRIEIYCQNGECQAREIAVIVLKDTYGAHNRADVRALEAIDRGRTEPPGPLVAKTLGEIMDGASQSGDILKRRLDPSPGFRYLD